MLLIFRNVIHDRVQQDANEIRNPVFDQSTLVMQESSPSKESRSYGRSDSFSPERMPEREIRGRDPASIHDYVHNRHDRDLLPIERRDAIMHETLSQRDYNRYYDNIQRHDTFSRMYAGGQINRPPPSISSLLSVPIRLRSTRSQAHEQTFRNFIRSQGQRTIAADMRTLNQFEGQVERESLAMSHSTPINRPERLFCVSAAC